MMPNKLQEEAYNLSKRLEPLYNEVSDAILNGATTSEALQQTGYYNRVTDEVLGAVNGAAVLGTEGTTFALNNEPWLDWYRNTNHHGGALSSNVRSSAASSAIRGVLKKGQAIENSVNALADTIQRSANAATDVKIPRALRELVTEYRTGNGLTPALERKIRDAEKYVKTLSGGPSRGGVQLKNSYSQIVKSAKSGKLKDEIVEKAISRKLRYVNETIARTEMSNGYELSRRRAYDEDPNVTHFSWELSPEHPIADECDYLAEADLYGKGAGVYPIDSGVTCPAHVKCLCTTFPILHEDTKGRYSEKRSQEYLEGQSPERRKRMIGASTPVQHGTQELKRKGIDPKAKTRAMMPKNLLQEK